MSELSDLYQEVILDHNKNPRNFREIENADKRADGNNPLCGDKLQVFLKMDGEMVEDVAFLGSGCAISKASASMMTQTVKGKTKEEAEKIFDEFHRMVTGKLDIETDENSLGKLRIFRRRFGISGSRKMCTFELAHGQCGRSTLHSRKEDENFDRSSLRLIF